MAGAQRHGPAQRRELAGRRPPGAQAWAKAKLEPIGLHESRHTYASYLVASRYDMAEIMEYMGHADLATTNKYVKRLPRQDESNPAERHLEGLAKCRGDSWVQRIATRGL